MRLFLCGLTLAAQATIASAQGTAFTYQGQLSNGGTAANGLYELTFTLYGASSGGSPLAATVTNSATPVTNGLFSVLLDFGNNPFTNGGPRWLELAVRTNSGGIAFNTLTPRQALTAVPYAITASNLTSVLPASRVR